MNVLGVLGVLNVLNVLYVLHGRIVGLLGLVLHCLMYGMILKELNRFGQLIDASFRPF